MSFKKSLYNPAEFTLTFELVPNRAGHGHGQNRILKLARQAAADGRLRAVSITENAGGHPALSPEVLGIEIQAMGLPVISHFSCKDKNRNQMESLLFGWDRAGLHNLLVISGDYPQHGYCGRPKPVFDLDSVQALDLISQMNTGQTECLTKNKDMTFQPTTFLKGVAVSPFKFLPQELLFQYMKLHRKAAAGADYIITQLGFDARKFEEVLLYTRLAGLDLPVLGNVFIPNMKVAALMYRGEVPGCVITESLYNDMCREADSADRGKRARLLRGAKLLAILQGLGYAGAHIGGPGLTFADLDLVMNEAAGMAADWRSLIPDLSYWPVEGCYFFESDQQTGLNLKQEAGLDKLPLPPLPLSYRLSHFVHQAFFEPEGALYRPTSRICLSMESGGREKILANIEHIIKLLIFDCQNCGDCRLSDLAYLCPQSGCAKYMLNGPCGGSRDGWCEVYPGRKRCFWVLVYERLTAHGLSFAQNIIAPPRDWSLNKTSSWLNFFINQRGI